MEFGSRQVDVAEKITVNTNIYYYGLWFSTEYFSKFCGPVHKIPLWIAAKLSKFHGLSWPSVCA